jgi:hypothetical protein
MGKYLQFCLLFAFVLFSFDAWAMNRSGTITMRFDLSTHSHGKTAQLWIPYPATNQYQTVSNISIKGNYSSSAVYTDAVFQSPMLYARWDPGSNSRKLTFSFDVVRKEVIRRDFFQCIPLHK